MKKTLPIVALVGLTNVGKSSLFNALLGKSRSIVSYDQHTTRDYVDDVLRLGQRSARLVDTAGLGKGDELVDLSTTSSANILSKAKVIILVIDGAVELSQMEQELARRMHKYDKKLLLVANKSDKKQLNDSIQKLGINDVYTVSSTTKQGINELREAIFSELPVTTFASTNETKIAFIGRPNVGKSSLINKILGSKRTVVSDIPGTTRDMTVSEFRRDGILYSLADSAGLRRPGKIGKGIEHFSATRTNAAIEWADICMLVVDSTELGVHQDLALAGDIIAAGKGLVLVANKTDLLSEMDLTKAQILAKLKRRYQFCYWAPVVLTSAQAGSNIFKLFDIIAQVADNQKRQLSTGRLNRFLTTVTHQHPPAVVGAGRLRLNYITQTDIIPPTFTIFANKPAQVHFSYRRFIENKLREEVDFTGTPIKLVFKDKHSS